MINVFEDGQKVRFDSGEYDLIKETIDTFDRTISISISTSNDFELFVSSKS